MWSWDWSQPFSWPGFVWGIVTAVLLPAAAIIFAVAIGTKQVRATVNAQLEVLQREEARAIAEERRLTNDRVAVGVEEALAAMGDLVEAAFTDDFRAAAKLRILAARRLPQVRARLGSDNEEIWDWVASELGIVALGLEDTDETHLPVLGEQIVWRSAEFVSALSGWIMGTRGLAWFTEANRTDRLSLAQTKRPVDD